MAARWRTNRAEMTPLRVCFTGVELCPDDLQERLWRGVIPSDWYRYRFLSDVSLIQLNRYLARTIEGRWASYSRYLSGKRQITIAFEHNYEGSYFVISEGATRCAVEEV